MGKMDQMIATWVREARKDAGLSQEALGAKLALELGEERGFTKANISHWETQKHSPNLKQLMAIAKITDRRLPQELLAAAGGASESTPDSVAEPGAEYASIRPAARIRIGAEPDTVPIKRVKVTLRAGVMRLEPVYDETYGEDLHIPVDVITRLQLDPHNLRAFAVRGRSGEPMFFEDDIVVVDISDTRPISRELYALLFDHEACIKQMLYRGGQWYLHSINPEFGPINAKSGELKIVGRVVYQPGRVVTGRL
jgi:transcriptional regulator with XRE-family HTH domain